MMMTQQLAAGMVGAVLAALPIWLVMWLSMEARYHGVEEVLRERLRLAEERRYFAEEKIRAADISRLRSVS